MNDVDILQNKIMVFFNNKDLSKLLWIILVRLKRQDSTTKIKFLKSYIMIVNSSHNIRIDNKAYGFDITIENGILQYFPFDLNHIPEICNCLDLETISSWIAPPPSSVSFVPSAPVGSTEPKPKQKKKTPNTTKRQSKPSNPLISNTLTNEPGPPAPTRDLTLQCSTCGRTFIFTKGEREFFQKKGFALPKRCKTCREQGAQMSDDYWYERGLKHNSYQQSLDVFGPRICVNPAPDKWC